MFIKAASLTDFESWDPKYTIIEVNIKSPDDGLMTMPSDLIVIDDYAFEGASLTTLSIPDSVHSIGIGAFKDCGSLRTVCIPASVTSIGAGAFDGCGSLKVYCVRNSVAHGYCVDNGISFKLVTLD